jgi:hypothetical protein
MAWHSLLTLSWALICGDHVASVRGVTPGEVIAASRRICRWVRFGSKEKAEVARRLQTLHEEGALECLRAVAVGLVRVVASACEDRLMKQALAFSLIALSSRFAFSKHQRHLQRHAQPSYLPPDMHQQGTSDRRQAFPVGLSYQSV